MMNRGFSWKTRTSRPRYRQRSHQYSRVRVRTTSRGKLRRELSPSHNQFTDASPGAEDAALLHRPRVPRCLLSVWPLAAWQAATVQLSNWLTISDTFWPPKPKLLLTACRARCSRALLGM